MTDISPYSVGRNIVNGFLRLEEHLLEACRFIPYCKEHERVWSPMLTDIIIGAGSKLDSLWGFHAQQIRTIKKEELNVKLFRKLFASRYESRWVVFWGDDPGVRLDPFCEWQYPPDAKNPWKLEWRDGYTTLKHNQLTNMKSATLKTAVMSMAALFLGIVRCEYCTHGVAEAHWPSTNLHSNNPRNVVANDESAKREHTEHLVLETKLFTYPRQWCFFPVKEWMVIEPATSRFKAWIRENDALQTERCSQGRERSAIPRHGAVPD